MQLLALCAIVWTAAACGTNAAADKPTPGPASQSQPGSAPGQTAPTRNTAPQPTLPPGDPNQPVSNKTKIAPPAPDNSLVQIRGRVTNAQGEPIARARLAFVKSSVPMPEMAYLTQADGTFALNVPRGEFTLAVNADGYAPQEREIDARATAEVQADFVLQPQ